MTCREAIEAVFRNEEGVLTTQDVINRILLTHRELPWKTVTVSCHLVGLSVNHPSSQHYPTLRKHPFLFSLGHGRYRRWKPEEDGTWVVTDSRVVLADEPEGVEPPGEEDLCGLSTTAVSLERDLEDALAANPGQLEPGLKVYEEDNVNGRQLDTGVVGRMDLLAVDGNGHLVVVELKAGQADERVCGQILRYMGWVNRELADGRPVRGIVVANSFHERIAYAVEAMPTVTLKRYGVRFEFTDPEPGRS